MTTTMSGTASTIIPAARVTVQYAQGLLEGVTADRFARKPEGVDTNHPAFCFGHLAIYPDWILTMIGREDLAQAKDGYEDMFKHGVECKDDPDGSIYPPMDEIMGYFTERHETLIGALEEISDETFSQVNPNEDMRDMCPTLGSLVNFMLNSHGMMHCGQISAWRRMMGLGPSKM